MKPIRILVYGMTNNRGGIETYLLNLFQTLLKYNVILDFVTDFSEIAYQQIIQTAGSQIYFIPPKGKHPVKHLTAFRKVLKEHSEYSKIYFNILDAGAFFSMLVPLFYRKEIIVHSHNGNTDKKILHYICRPFLVYAADHKVACSKVAAAYMFGKSRISETLLIPNMIALSKYRYDIELRKTVREKNNLIDKFVICHIGRMSHQKNPFRLLDIFKEVLLMEPKAILLYIGTGELKQQIQQYVYQSGIERAVVFLGIREDIPEWLCASDVFLLPSLYEGLPIVGVEAQAAGLPCVVSNNISQEINISGDVIFCDLEDDNKYWAKKVLETQNMQRSSDNTKLKVAGYDSNCPSENYEKLIHCFTN